MNVELPSTLVLLLLAIIASTYFIYKHFWEVSQDQREPKLIPQALPFVGHAIGILRNKMEYFHELSAKYPLPIYGLSVFGEKIYIVNSSKLVMAVNRNPKSLAFRSLGMKLTTRLLGPSKEATALVMENAGGERGDWGITITIVKELHKGMAPGVDLNRMSRSAVHTLAAAFQFSESDADTRINLLEWLRHAITQATTNSVYGPMNPFKNPEVENAFWQFEKDVMLLLIGFMPAVTARRGHNGRKKVIKAFIKYFAEKGHQTGSDLIKSRYTIQQKYGMSIKDVAHFELGNSLALLANTVSSAFWVLYYLYSNPLVLADVRVELAKSLKTTSEKIGITLHTLDLTRIKDCSLLSSVFQESLRHQSFGTSVRAVMEDVLLDDTYLLKKGSIVQMPNRETHFDHSIWGPSVNDFDARRFIKSPVKLHRPGSFRAFGGGAFLCAGRFFARTEIMSLAAMLAVRYDMTPVSGQWIQPETDLSNMIPAVSPPKQDICINLMSRKGYEGGSWTFELHSKTCSNSVREHDEYGKVSEESQASLSSI